MTPKRHTIRLLVLVAVVLSALAATAPGALAAPPVNETPPTISGTAAEGQTLTASNGTWSNNPTAFQYQWQRCRADGAGCVAVPGAIERTYLLTQADVGHRMRVRVLAVNADGATPARSGPTAAVTATNAPQNTARPSVSGEARVGRQLTADPGTWTGSPTSFAYQWQRCDIDGLLRHRGRERPHVQRGGLGSRLPAACRGARDELERLGPGILGADRSGAAGHTDHQHAAVAEDHLDPVPRRPRLRALPNLRRLAQEPDDPGD
jgi:hypothetical protein